MQTWRNEAWDTRSSSAAAAAATLAQTWVIVRDLCCFNELPVEVWVVLIYLNV